VLFMGPSTTLTPPASFPGITHAGRSILRVPYTSGGQVRRAQLHVISGLCWRSRRRGPIVCPRHVDTTFIGGAALAGFGGGNFASSMTNINTLFPEAAKGWRWAQRRRGNLGVAVAQLIGLLIIGVSGITHPRLLLAVYIPRS